jgi:hypothetical protein
MTENPNMKSICVYLDDSTIFMDDDEDMQQYVADRDIAEKLTLTDWTKNFFEDIIHIKDSNEIVFNII